MRRNEKFHRKAVLWRRAKRDMRLKTEAPLTGNMRTCVTSPVNGCLCLFVPQHFVEGSQSSVYGKAYLRLL